MRIRASFQLTRFLVGFHFNHYLGVSALGLYLLWFALELDWGSPMPILDLVQDLDRN